MAPKPETIGGGSARGVSDQFSQLLMQGMNGGFSLPQYGQSTGMDNLGRSNPMGSTMNIQNALATLLNGGGNLANSALQVGANRREEDVANLRSRYALGGTGYGTPAAVGEGRFLGEFDPQLAGQVGGLQMDGITKALGFLFPGLQQAYGLGTPQAQTVMKPSGIGQALNIAQGVAGAIAPFALPGIGGAAAGPTMAASQGSQLGQASRYNFDGTHADYMNPGQGNAWDGYGIGRNSFGQSWWAN